MIYKEGPPLAVLREQMKRLHKNGISSWILHPGGLVETPDGPLEEDGILPYAESNRTGFLVMEPLGVLVGRPWDGVAMGMLQSLRPSRVEIVKAGQGTKLDTCLWRVRVYLEEDNQTIERIEQEVQVGLPEGIENGHDLKELLLEDFIDD
jgi:hypothetical protein